MDKAVTEFNLWKSSGDTKKQMMKQIRSLCKKHKVTKSPLRRRLGLEGNKRNINGKTRGFCEQVATDQEEKELVNWLKARKVCKLCPTLKLFQRAAKMHISNPIFKGSYNWWLGFCKRHEGEDISLEKPEIETLSRAQAKTEPAVRQHFDVVETAFAWIREKNGIETVAPNCIGNTDEKPILTKKKVKQK